MCARSPENLKKFTKLTTELIYRLFGNEREFLAIKQLSEILFYFRTVYIYMYPISLWVDLVKASNAELIVAKKFFKIYPLFTW